MAYFLSSQLIALNVFYLSRVWAKRSLTPTVVDKRNKEKQALQQKKALQIATALPLKSGRKENVNVNVNGNGGGVGGAGGGGGRSARVLTSRPGSGRTQEMLAMKRQVNKNRCGECRRKLGLVTRYPCRCGGNFCPTHRLAEAHHCTYDYKGEGRKTLALNNPRVLSNKLPKF